MRELAPPQSAIPIIHVQSIAVEYTKEYIIVEPMNTSDICQGFGSPAHEFHGNAMSVIFQFNSPAVSKLIWLELDQDLGNDYYVEKRLALDGQCSVGVGPNVCVDVPVNKVTFREFVRLVFDTGTILQNELEVRHGTSLDKIDRYFS